MKHPAWTYPLRYFTAGLTGYETAAILIDKPWMPTLSRLAYEHKWFGPTLVIALIIHLAWPVEGRPPVIEEIMEIS